MSKIEFIPRTFTSSSMELIEHCNTILEEYEAQGFRLSLRQLYYQLVARDIIPNTLRSYKHVGNVVSDGRLAGLIDWEMIEDRNRETQQNTHWENPAEIVAAAARSFQIDRWEGQPAYVEVMVEKDALSGILAPVCRSLDVRFTANKGYSSSSAMYEAGKRVVQEAEHRDIRSFHIFYLGDHDPSGIDMTRDVAERLELFTAQEVRVHDITRLALNFDQVEDWKPPKNPAKQTDSRFEAYARQFGRSSWELDAVDPNRLASLVRTAIHRLIDVEQWEKVEAKEKKMQAELNAFVANYGKKRKK